MKHLAALLVLAVASPLLAADYERVMLPVAPSVVHCGYHSRYDTRLIVYNDDTEAVKPFCSEEACGVIAPKTGSELAGSPGDVPLPSFLYLPKDAAATMRLSLVVESSDLDHPEERSFIELPVVRESEFVEGKMQLIGVRMEEGFRQTVRMYGLDGHAYGAILMKVFELGTNRLLHQCLHELWPLSPWVNENGQQARPSFGMECDMSSHLRADGKKVRVELEPLTPGLKYWAFISVTNNKTQHFYTVTPR